MTDGANPQSESLVAAAVEAFPRYLEEKLDSLGIEMTVHLADVIAEAATALDKSLKELMAVPPLEQEQSPLELVRAATLPVTHMLADAGEPRPMRDEQDAEIHPEDLYGLYPATSRDLGDEAWQAHMQWGIEKARTVAGLVPADAPAARIPAVALFGLSRERRAVISPALRDRGYASLVWRNPAALADGIAGRPELVLVDLDHPAAHDAIRTVAAAELRAIAVGSKIDDLVTPGLLALGVETVVDLDRLVDRLPGLLPHIV